MVIPENTLTCDAGSDAYVIDLYFARDERAIRLTDERYGKHCRAIAYNILADDGESEECVNDTWLRTWNAIPPTRPNSLRAFVGRITRNLALNRWKARRRRVPCVDEALEEFAECLPDTLPDDGGLGALFDEFLGGLTETDCNVFVLRYWHMAPVERIAAAVGISENAVYLRLSKTREKLRTFLNQRGYRL